MKQNTSKEKERKNVIIEAKGICCDLTGKNDFGFVSKLEMALIIRNLTIDFHEKKSFIASQKEAIDSFKEAVEVNPGYAMAHKNLAVIYCNNKQYDLAIKHCDMADKLGYKVSPEFLERLEPHRR